MAKKITIVEVGLRDGLQNESIHLSLDARFELASKLIAAGIQRLEVGAFVRADKVPQMQGTKDLVLELYKKRKSHTQLSVLVPNEKGMLEALQTQIPEVAIFGACSESFSQKNINCSIEESLYRFESVLLLAKQNKIKVRGYLSTCFGCPYEGKVEEKKVIQLAKKMLAMGCYEISIGDTIGVATPFQVESLFKKLKKVVPVKKLAAHFHDTRGTALANILTAYHQGITIFDSSIGGLGGCPYAPGASGNVSTEDVVYMFQGMKVNTGVNLQKLIDLNLWLSRTMQKSLNTKVGKAGLLKPIF
jgi:hydroxymethylglutaryl-CoA lyase